MEILAVPSSFFHQKHQITPAKFSISKTKFWNLFYIIRKRPPDRDKPLRTLFSSSEMSKISKKLCFFQPKPRFRMVFHGFPCQNFIHCSRHAYSRFIHKLNRTTRRRIHRANHMSLVTRLKFLGGKNSYFFKNIVLFGLTR